MTKFTLRIKEQATRLTPFFDDDDDDDDDEVKPNTPQAWKCTWGSRSLRLPKFLDKRHMKMVRLSALRPGHLYTPLPGDTPGTHFC